MSEQTNYNSNAMVIFPVYSYTVVRALNTHFDAISASQVGVVSLVLFQQFIN